MDNIDVVLDLLDSSIILAQCTRLDAYESFKGVARFSVIDAHFELEDIFNKVQDLVKALLGASCDVFMHEESYSLSFDDIVLPNPLDHSYVSSICSTPSPSPRVLY